MVTVSMSSAPVDRRRDPRFELDPPYTPVRVRVRRSLGRVTLHGHAYDISSSGMRFELDAALPVGELVDVEVTLNGERRRHLRGRGTVVRRHDADEVGPVRMGVRFTQLDRPILTSYFAERCRRMQPTRAA